jgi:hypothetical protein
MNKSFQQNLADSKVKTAILFLTLRTIPDDENYDFVVRAVESFSINEARSLIYDNYYNEILEWSDMNDW